MNSTSEQPFQGNKNAPVDHPVNGGLSFGYIPEINHRGEVIPGGEIHLRVGRHHGPNRGFGINHIWLEHANELRRLGYEGKDGVIQFVADIIVAGASLYSEFACMRGNHRVSVLRSSKGLAILEPKRLGRSDEFIHSVVTAFPKGQARGVLVGNVAGSK